MKYVPLIRSNPRFAFLSSRTDSTSHQYNFQDNSKPGINAEMCHRFRQKFVTGIVNQESGCIPQLAKDSTTESVGVGVINSPPRMSSDEIFLLFQYQIELT